AAQGGRPLVLSAKSPRRWSHGKRPRRWATETARSSRPATAKTIVSVIKSESGAPRAGAVVPGLWAARSVMAVLRTPKLGCSPAVEHPRDCDSLNWHSHREQRASGLA